MFSAGDEMWMQVLHGVYWFDGSGFNVAASNNLWKAVFLFESVFYLPAA